MRTRRLRAKRSKSEWTSWAGASHVLMTELNGARVGLGGGPSSPCLDVFRGVLLYRLIGDKPLYIYSSPYMRTKQVRSRLSPSISGVWGGKAST